MPRRPIEKPEALAKIVASMESLVPSAKDVTFGRVLIVFGRELSLRLGRSVTINQSLEIAGSDRAEADAFDIAEQRHRDARFIAVGIGDDNAGAVCPELQYRTNGRVQFGVDEDDVLTMADGINSNVGSELDRAGDFDHHIDVRCLANELGIIHNRRNSFFHTVFEGPGRGNGPDLVDARIVESARCMVQCPIGNGYQAHADNRGQQLSAIIRPVTPAPTIATRIG